MKSISQLTIVLIIAASLIFTSCQKPDKKGKLFIVGGGRISPAMIDKMITESKLNEGGYGIILPMSSEEPDSAIVEHKPGFVERGCSNIWGLQFKKGEAFSQVKIDSIRNARLIFISGGDQSRFMDIIAGTQICQAIHDAFNNGSVIGGTSAGASLMSKTMVTGNELKYPDNTGTFNSMEANNVEVVEGLGFLENVVIDQHFIKRKRLNRQVCISIENPGKLCVGIDEATAIYVDGCKATVYGVNQVVVLHNKSAEKKVQNGLLGVKGLELDVFLPGESFDVKP
jgi:cyanophycinase